MKKKYFSICMLICSLICNCLNAQNFPASVHKAKNSNKSNYIKKPGHLYLNFISNDSSKIRDIDLTEIVDVIVEFKEPPLFISQLSSGLQKTNTAAYQAVQVKFTNNLNEIAEALQKQFNTSFSDPQKKEEYYKIFFGVALSIPRAMLPGILSLDYVKQIHLDKKYSANLKGSIRLIGADSVWNVYGNIGDSIRVAILDTGIDYLHPALGKGFGKGFKVIGGYDFVNKDNDPKDDNGHGTHVAGIVAANSDSIKGVAPGALLYAFKVLNSYGNGGESKIIAGIERTVDPDNDGNSNDKVDIANMSLGGSGSPNDALSTAVNNAVKLGVVFCVSAGNNSYYNTIGSPGCAVRAITVGSTDKSNALSYFSSKGPAADDYTLKPDVLAPGSDIKSAYLNGSYQTLSGTSMAAPHVAGTCALIKKQHKDWTPEMIKSAVVSTAKSINLDVMTEGNGIVNAFKAVNAATLLIPSTISFGLDNQNVNTWQKTDTVLIINKSETAKNYSMGSDGIFAGLSIDFKPANFSIQPGGTIKVTVSISVDNSIVSDNKNILPFYSGKIFISSLNEVISIPWSFTKMSFLSLTFDKPYTTFFFYNKEAVIFDDDIPNYDWSKKSFKIPMPSGIYRMWAMNDFSDDYRVSEMRFHYKEGIEINKNRELFVNSSEANLDVNIQGVDETGNAFNRLGNVQKGLYLTNIDTSVGGGMGILGYPDSMKIKSTPLPFSIEMKAAQFHKDLNNKKTIHLIQFPYQYGLTANTSFTNKPSDFIRQSINLNLAPDRQNYSAQFGWGDLSWGGLEITDYIRTKNWLGTLYMTSQFTENFGFTVYLITDMENTDMFMSGNWFITSPITVFNDSIRIKKHDNWFYKGTYFSSPNKGILTFGDGAIIPLCDHSWYNNGKNFSYSSDAYFIGQLGEYRYSDTKFTMFELRQSDGALIDSGIINSNIQNKIEPGNYRSIITNNHYSVGGDFGKAVLTTDFSVNQNHDLIPEIADLKVLNSLSCPVNKLDPKENGKIKLTVQNIRYWELQAYADINVFIKKTKSTVWEESINPEIIELTPDKRIYNYNMGDLNKFDKSAVDLKITIKNENSNKIEYLLQPAFVVGDYISRVDIDSVNSSDAASDFQLSDNFPNPFNSQTNIYSSVPFQSHVEIKIFDILGREICKLVDEVKNNGKYTAKFDAAKLSSGVYFYTIKAGGFARVKKMVLLK